MIDFSALEDDIIDTLQSQVAREMYLSARHDAWRYADDYLAGLTVEREGADIVVRVKGLVPNFVEQGLGPGGLGTEGPFDMRTFTLKGKDRRAIPIKPGVIRMMSAKGAPWMHPGFKRHALLPKLVQNLDYVLSEASKHGKWWSSSWAGLKR